MIVAKQKIKKFIEIVYFNPFFGPSLAEFNLTYNCKNT